MEGAAESHGRGWALREGIIVELRSLPQPRVLKVLRMFHSNKRHLKDWCTNRDVGIVTENDKWSNQEEMHLGQMVADLPAECWKHVIRLPFF